MKIHEIITESRHNTLNVPDKYGGMIKIDPDPTLERSPTKFSMAYINHTMAKFYNVNPRILGYDSHGHIGIPEPHFHGFSRNKSSGYFRLGNSSMALPYHENVQIFYGCYLALIRMYKKDITNVK